MEGRIDTQSWGPGLSLVSFSGIVDTLNLAATTPIERDKCIIRFNFRFKTMGDLTTTENVGKAFRQRGAQATPRRQADLGAQGASRAASTRRHRRGRS